MTSGDDETLLLDDNGCEVEVLLGSRMVRVENLILVIGECMLRDVRCKSS